MKAKYDFSTVFLNRLKPIQPHCLEQIFRLYKHLLQDAASGVYYKEYSSDVSAENAQILAQKSDFATNYPGFSMPTAKYMFVGTWNKMELSKSPRSNSEVTGQMIIVFDRPSSQL